ncbi:MAG: MarR family transcriptional regulator [Planctomycetota bacterium]
MARRSKAQLAPDAYLTLVRAHERLAGGMHSLFKQHGLTQATYNVLRILRGAGPEGLPCSSVGDRLVTRVPDVTRLLDRMERDGLVRRERSSEDRRVVLAFLSDEGRARVDSLDEPVLAAHLAQFEGFTTAELESLISALGRFLEPVPTAD